MKKSLWERDDIQFPRLIYELELAGAITFEVMQSLQASMDIEDEEDILELLGRAQAAYHRNVEKYCPPGGT